MPKLIINDWTGGLAPNYWRGRQLTKVGADNQYAGGVVNPLRNVGFLSPASKTFTALTNIGQLASTTPVLRFVGSDDGLLVAGGFQTIYFAQSTKLHAVRTDTDTIQIAGGSPSFPHTVGSVLRDIIVYQLNGLPALCYAYSTEMGALSNLLSSPTFDDVVLSTSTGGAVLSSTFDVILEVADNNFLYIANGNAIHKFDGTSAGGTAGTETQSVIDLGVNWMVVDMRDGAGYLWIAAVNSLKSTISGLFDVNAQRKVAIYVWNKLSSSLTFTDVIPVVGANTVHSLFFVNGIPHCITSSFEGVVQLRRYTGRDFEVIREVGNNSGTTDARPANRHAVVPFSNGVLWQAQNGRIYWYGRIADGIEPGLYILGESDAASFTSAGAIFVKNADTLYVSYVDGSTNKVSTYLPNSASGATTSTGNYFSKVYELPKLSRITGLTVYYPKLSSGANANMTMSVYTNFSTTAANASDLQVNYQDVPTGDGSRGYKYFPLGGEDFEAVNAIQIGIDWATGQTIAASVRPSRVEIEYEPTDRKK